MQGDFLTTNQKWMGFAHAHLQSQCEGVVVQLLKCFLAFRCMVAKVYFIILLSERVKVLKIVVNLNKDGTNYKYDPKNLNENDNSKKNTSLQ